MKTQIILVALLLLGTATFAQTKLADEFPAMLKARNSDVISYFQTNSTPGLIFIAGNDGSIQNKEWLMNLLRNNKNQTTEIANLNIQQAGDLAVATGVSTIKVVSNEGKTSVYKDAFTYTMRWIGGQWMFTNIHHTKIDYK